MSHRENGVYNLSFLNELLPQLLLSLCCAPSPLPLTMSQAQTPVSPDLNPRRNRAPSPSPNALLESDAHLNSGMAPVLAKTTVVPDNSNIATTAVASATVAVVGTLKRPREEHSVEAGTLTDVPEAKRRVKATHDVIYRIVVPSWQIGKVIGRAGHRIQQIRESTKATIKIADAISVSRLMYIPLFFGFALFFPLLLTLAITYRTNFIVDYPKIY